LVDEESVVMRMSGHKTRSVFERYNVVEEDDLREATRKLEAGAAVELGQDLGNVGQDAYSGGSWTPIPDEGGQRFRRKVDTRSGGRWTLIPGQGGHLFRTKPATRA